MWILDIVARHKDGHEMTVSGVMTKNPFWFLDRTASRDAPAIKVTDVFSRCVAESTVGEMVLSDEVRNRLIASNVTAPYGRWFKEQMATVGFDQSVRVRRPNGDQTRLYYKSKHFGPNYRSPSDFMNHYEALADGRQG